MVCVRVCVCVCVQVAKLANVIYKTRKANLQLQVLAGSAGFLYPALTVGWYVFLTLTLILS